MTGLERDFLHQLTRIADALEKQNKLQEQVIKDMNTDATTQDVEENQEDQEDITQLLKKLSKFK